jgi:hypothetical protein
MGGGAWASKEGGKEGRGGGGGSEEGKDAKEKDEPRVREGGGKEIIKGVEGFYISIPRVPECLSFRPN